MRVVVVGGGGRESALVRAIARHGHSVWATHANPAFAGRAQVMPGDPVTVARTVAAELVVVGPEAPLAEGVVDRCEEAGIAAFGPSAAAARLETSKVHTKNLALKYDLPTATAHVVRAGDGFVVDQPWVVKLDGLAAGKGVWVCDTAAEAREALAAAFAARPDAEVLLEERLIGPELSVLGLCDGERVVPLPAARDHKRRFDGDLGPNTGGMGAIAPVPVTPGMLAGCHDVLRRAVTAMAAEGTPFRGVLYGGFMLTASGPKLLEFNVRFGDPECQAIMALFDEDPVPWLLGAAKRRLPDGSPRFKDAAACCVVVSAKDYPEGRANTPILRLPADAADLLVDQAGTALHNGELWATGGRVLSVTGLGATPADARARAYRGLNEVEFAGAAWRMDIGR